MLFVGCERMQIPKRSLSLLNNTKDARATKEAGEQSGVG